MKWCLDTSALIEPWVRRYPPDIFGPVWTKLEELADAGIIGAPVDVRKELEKQSDPLLYWAVARNGFFVESDRKTVELFTDIVNDHPGFMKIDSTKSGADPMVVAMAQRYGIPVVTYETFARKAESAPKIPNVCDKLGIQVVSLVDVLRANGFKL